VTSTTRSACRSTAAASCSTSTSRPGRRSGTRRRRASRATHYRFEDVYSEPKPFRPDGPRLWFGGESLHPRLLRRLVRHGHGFNPLGQPSADDLERLRAAMSEAGRDLAELELVGGTRAEFPSPDGVAHLERALDAIPPQLERGFSSFCLKPSQFTDDPAEVGRLCARAVEYLHALGEDA